MNSSSDQALEKSMEYFHPFQTCQRLIEEVQIIRGPTKSVRELADKLLVASYMAREGIPFVRKGGRERIPIGTR